MTYFIKKLSICLIFYCPLFLKISRFTLDKQTKWCRTEKNLKTKMFSTNIWNHKFLTLRYEMVRNWGTDIWTEEAKIIQEAVLFRHYWINQQHKDSIVETWVGTKDTNREEVTLNNLFQRNIVLLLFDIIFTIYVTKYNVLVFANNFFRKIVLVILKS